MSTEPKLCALLTVCTGRGDAGIGGLGFVGVDVGARGSAGSVGDGILAIQYGIFCTAKCVVLIQ